MVSDFEKGGFRPRSTGLEALLGRATTNQRDEIERAASENTPGVEQLAARILDDPDIQSPVAVLLSKIRHGAHQTAKRGTDGINQRNHPPIPWDPQLAEANAARARALIQRLAGNKGTMPAKTTPPVPLDEDDDIPGYGDTP